jgi:type III restriction enzyme
MSDAAWAFGIEPESADEIRRLCERTPGVVGLWIFGSRARGDHRARSDIDLMVDAPSWTTAQQLGFHDELRHLPTVYTLDLVWWQGEVQDALRERILRDRQPFWAQTAAVPATVV